MKENKPFSRLFLFFYLRSFSSLLRMLGVCVLLMWSGNSPSLFAQTDMGGNSSSRSPLKPKEKVYERPAEATLPLPTPLSSETLQARERAKKPGSLQAPQELAEKIYEIHVEGSRKIEPDAVLMQIKSRLGSELDPALIKGDIQRIYNLGVFDDVIVEYTYGIHQGIILTYRLQEKPALDEIKFEGNLALSEDDIKEVVDLKTYQVFEHHRLVNNAQKIQKLYIDKGYYLATIEPIATPSATLDARFKNSDGESDVFQDENTIRDTPGEHKTTWMHHDAPLPTGEGGLLEGRFMDVTFRIHEGEKVQVTSIHFSGNNALSDDDIRLYLKTKESHLLGPLTEWGTYKDEDRDINSLIIEELYQEKGYIYVKVSSPRVVISPDRQTIQLTFDIEEGHPYTVAQQEIQGDFIVDDATSSSLSGTHIISDDALRTTPVMIDRTHITKRLKVKAGDPFARSKIATDVQMIADLYRDRGYAFANVTPDTVIDEKSHSIALRYSATAGPRVTIERIEFFGNNKTRDEVIRRELKIVEGELFSGTKLRISEQRLNALGYFEKVAMTTQKGSRDDTMVVRIAVTERSTGQIQFGAGLSSQEGLMFNGQISYANFLGHGTTVQGSLQWSSLRRIFELRYVDPYAWMINDTPLTFSIGAYNNNRSFIEFLRDSTGFDVMLGYPIGSFLAPLSAPWLQDASPSALPYIPNFENLAFYLSATAERVQISGVSYDVDYVGLSSHLPRYTTSLKGTLLFDQRNNRLFPSAGYFAQLSAEFADPVLGAGLLPGVEAGLKQSLSDAGVQRLGWLKSSATTNQFQRFNLVLRGYYDWDAWFPLKGVVLKANLDFGFLNSDGRLVFENYFLGGFNTIRGFYPRSISPITRLTSTQNPLSPLIPFKTGGNKQLIANLEIEFPIVQQLGFRGVLFLDGGNVFAPDENWFYIGTQPNQFLEKSLCGKQACWDARTELPLGIYSSWGLGVRWMSPVGMFRFEFGFPLTRRPPGTPGVEAGDQAVQFELGIGTLF